MKNKTFNSLLAVALCGIASLNAADTTTQNVNMTPWYATVSSGYAWSINTGTDNPNPSDWDYSNQGYSTTVGGSPFFTLGLGKTVVSFMDVDLSYTFFQPFHYQMYQTGSSDTPGFTGNARTRYFDLDHQNIMVGVNFHPPKGSFELHMGKIALSPYGGASIGLGAYSMNHFYTVGYTSSVGSTTSIGDRTNSYGFAWSAQAGFNLRPVNSGMNFSLGYRYYDGGKFTGPSNLVLNDTTYTGSIYSATPWTGHLRTHQLVGSLNFEF